MHATRTNPRDERLHSLLPDDQREPGKRDRDRILYSTAFQRLSGITQVISPSENRICHNRLTHSLKVGQVARRLAELLTKNHERYVETVGGINPDIVESASLAHDLGHPPFGHAGEIGLQECFEERLPGSESFEGNAQSFRVVTRLAVRSVDFDGLDLTRATLNAMLKYPWGWKNRKKPNKWGSYQEEKKEFTWARRSLPPGAMSSPTIEAEIMDTADDISYAVHDLEDFYRAGMIPLDRIAVLNTKTPKLTEEGDEFVREVFERRGRDIPGTENELKKVIAELLAPIPIRSPYKGLSVQRAALRTFTSSLIGRYINSADLRPGALPGNRLFLPPVYRQEIFMLQQLTSHYMIYNPALSMQQEGQKRLIKELFKYFYEAALNGKGKPLPPRVREMMNPLIDGTYRGSKKSFCTRLAADIVSSMTEDEAMSVAHRILGISFGSAFDQFI